jgi:hypothetical protein
MRAFQSQVTFFQFFCPEKRPSAKMDIFKNVQNRFAKNKLKPLFFHFFEYILKLKYRYI